jgi:hypothetical protein
LNLDHGFATITAAIRHQLPTSNYRYCFNRLSPIAIQNCLSDSSPGYGRQHQAGG